MSPAASTPSTDLPVATAPLGEGRPALAGLVRRERLIARLAATRDTPVLMLIAPGGYGKTTALVDWTEDDDRPSEWLTLDERHDDPVVLLGAIAAVLHRIEPIGEEVVAPLTTPRIGVSSAVVPRLCAALRNRKQPFILVLDDLHLDEQSECVEPLAAIACAIPPGSQLALASRTEPPLPLGRMRADRRLAEVGAKELAMTTREATETLAKCGHTLPPESVTLKQLVELTEGWPVGLYLAGLSLSSTGNLDASAQEIHGDDRLVADYMRDAFLSRLDGDTMQFLIQTSILDRLSGDVCDYVLKREGSAEMLHRLVRSNLLVVPLDGRDRVYRYHALFREMLQAELQRSTAAVASGLHTRACAWYRERGDVDRAISHAIEAGDRDLAAELIWINTAEYVSGGRYATVRGWLDHFSEAQIATSPALCLAQATGHLIEGDGVGVERWTALALERLSGRTSGDEDDLAIGATVIRAGTNARPGEVLVMLEDARDSYASLPSDSPWRPLCRFLEGVASHLSSNPDPARSALEEGARIPSTPAVQSLCRSQLALLALDAGDAAEAERQAALAVAQVDHYGLGDHPIQALTFAVSALVRARRGRSAAAAADAKQAVRLLTGLNEFSPWYESEVRIILARALLLLDDGLAARSHLADAGRYVPKVGDAEVLRGWLDAAWAEVESASSVAGRWPLTPAELRLLHVLPTHFSFREIADRQFISPNTVKTQAQSVYRKLGVSSRAEAVACARAAGLLDGEPEDSPERGDA